jgi:hypothetical protein
LVARVPVRYGVLLRTSPTGPSSIPFVVVCRFRAPLHPFIPINEEAPQANSDKPLSVVRPNPFGEKTNILINSPDAERDNKIYNAEGKLVLTKTAGLEQQRLILVKTFLPGVYTAIIITVSSSRKKPSGLSKVK